MLKCHKISFTWGSVLSSSDKQSIALLNTSSTSFFSWPEIATEKNEKLELDLKSSEQGWEPVTNTPHMGC